MSADNLGVGSRESGARRKGFACLTGLRALVVALLLALSLGAILGPSDALPWRRMVGGGAVGLFLVSALVLSWFFYPVWTGEVIPYSAWQIRMWFPTWV